MDRWTDGWTDGGPGRTPTGWSLGFILFLLAPSSWAVGHPCPAQGPTAVAGVSVALDSDLGLKPSSATLAARPQPTDLNALCLSLLIYKMGLILE